MSAGGSPRRPLARLGWVLAALLSGCGPVSAVWVRVEAPLLVPDDCDSLELEVRRGADGPVVYAHTYDLSGGPAFPLTLSLTTDNPENLGEEALVVEVSALKGGALARPWARATQGVSLREGRVTEVVVELCDCAR